jgi:hypothetical protein
MPSLSALWPFQMIWPHNVWQLGEILWSTLLR